MRSDGSDLARIITVNFNVSVFVLIQMVYMIIQITLITQNIQQNYYPFRKF